MSKLKINLFGRDSAEFGPLTRDLDALLEQYGEVVLHKIPRIAQFTITTNLDRNDMYQILEKNGFENVTVELYKEEETS